MRAAAIAAVALVTACSQPAAAPGGSLTEEFPMPTPEQNAEAGAAFLARNRAAPGVTVTASGLQYKVIKAGPANGPRPTANDTVRVHYEGKLLDGAVFDSSYQRGEPAAFPVGALIPAWVEALQLMRPGDVWEIWAPSNIAYGAQGAGGVIPPNATLHFKMELIAIEGR